MINNKIRTILFSILLFFTASIWSFGGTGNKELTDDQITSKVETELLFQEEVPSERIDVTTTDHIVTLDGFTSNLRASNMAQRVAMAVKGVKGVINHIQVYAPTRSDLDIKSDIDMALLTDPATEAFEVIVEVDDGTAELSGEVDSWQEMMLVEYVASGVRGVKDIDNNVFFTPKSNRSDVEIKTEILKALESDIRLEPEFLTVNVKDGKVTITGETGSLNEKEQILYYSWTAGVKDVDSEGLKIRNWLDEYNFKDEKSPVINDKIIEDYLVRSFSYDPRLQNYSPVILVKNGVAYLSGTVDNLKAKRSAEQNAMNTQGVEFVYNNIRVRDEIRTNAELEDAVVNALVRQSDLSRHNISANAVNGRIYLAGVVSNQFQKELAEDVTSTVRGVVAIENQIAVANEQPSNTIYAWSFDWNNFFPTPYVRFNGISPVSDPQIEKNIESELWWSPYVEKDEIEVDVVAGAATLSGTVDSNRERWLAVQNAYEGGAISVIDKLKLE